MDVFRTIAPSEPAALVQIESAVDNRSELRPTAIFHWDSIDGDKLRTDTAMAFLGIQMDSTPNPLTFPFVGWAILGADVPAERRFAPMLLSGRVEIYGKTLFKQRYRAGGAELEAGDKFAVIRPAEENKEKIGTASSGLIRPAGQSTPVGCWLPTTRKAKRPRSIDSARADIVCRCPGWRC